MRPSPNPTAVMLTSAAGIVAPPGPTSAARDHVTLRTRDVKVILYILHGETLVKYTGRTWQNDFNVQG
jgi:hypothetical protein